MENEMKELIERMRYCAARAPNYSKQMFEAANALEQQASRIAELEALLKEAYSDADDVLRPRVADLETELAKYRNAPVVAWRFKSPLGFVRLQERAPMMVADPTHHNWQKLIIKPEES